MRKISFLAKNAIIGLKQGYEGFAIRGRLFVYAVLVLFSFAQLIRPMTAMIR